MRAPVILLLSALTLCACTTERSIRLPNGAMGHLIRCNGAALSWDDCYARAGDVCAAGYQVVGQDGSESPMLIAQPNGSVFAGSVVSRSMMVQCR